MNNTLMTETELHARLSELLGAGCAVDLDEEAGVVSAQDEYGHNVFRAIQKGAGGPWLAFHRDGRRVKWAKQSLPS